MPITYEQKQRSRTKILNSAVALFTKYGYANVSIDQVMAAANMTRGAFYAHFESKSDVYQAAIITAAKNSELVKSKPQNSTDKGWVEQLLRGYLSLDHIQQKGASCPLAFLVTDVVNRDSSVRETYTQVFKNMRLLLQGYISHYSVCDEQKILAIIAMSIGGVAVGRALDDEVLAQRLLDACYNTATDLIEDSQFETP